MTKFEINQLSKDQTNFLKGCGILLIVLHNFFHNLTPVIGENEFSFSLQISSKFYQTLASSPYSAMRLLFTFFGHYGVQMFVFLSAYGLTLKYASATIPFREYIFGRFKKIYISFLLCLALYIFLGVIKSQFLTDEKVLFWDSIAWKVLLISNFIPGQAMMPVGPWWFLPFIFQVYIAYPFILKGFRKHGNKFLILISTISILFSLIANPYLMRNNLNVNHTVIGHLPVICFGIFAASAGKILIPRVYAVLFVALFFTGDFSEFAWIFKGLSFVVISLICTELYFQSKLNSGFISKIVVFYGAISFQLFMVNGFLRSPFHNLAEAKNIWWLDNILAILSLLFSTLVAFLLLKTDVRARAIFREKFQ